MSCDVICTSCGDIAQITHHRIVLHTDCMYCSIRHYLELVYDEEKGIGNNFIKTKEETRYSVLYR